MKRIYVNKVECVVVSFKNDSGDWCAVPLYRERDGRWQHFGAYQKFGVSPSDPKFASVFPLPHKWRPKGKLAAALRKVK